MATFYNKTQVDDQAVVVGQAIKAVKTAVTQVTGQSTTEAVSQKLLTDELSTTNGKVTALEGTSGTIKNGMDNTTLTIWVLTQAQLDAIAVKDDAVIYMVKA